MKSETKNFGVYFYKIFVLQIICIIAVLLMLFIVKFLSKDLFSEFKNWYKEEFSYSVSVSDVLDEN